jgi:hypothetical protein
MDYMWGLPSTKRGNDFFFVVVEIFSKMEIMDAYKKRITTKAIGMIFFEQVWIHFGITQNIISNPENWFLNTF